MATSPTRNQSFPALRTNDKNRVVEHYDVISPYYRALWGEHLHHGYWIRGDESKEQAQLQLAEAIFVVSSVEEALDAVSFWS